MQLRCSSSQELVSVDIFKKYLNKYHECAKKSQHFSPSAKSKKRSVKPLGLRQRLLKMTCHLMKSMSSIAATTRIWLKTLTYKCVWTIDLKGNFLHMKVITSIKAKGNVFLWYVQCCSCTRISKTEILTTRAPPSWIEFNVVTSQRQIESASDCVMLLESITRDSETIFLAFTRD